MLKIGYHTTYSAVIYVTDTTAIAWYDTGMGEPALKRHADHNTKQLYVPERKLTIVQGDSTAERFNDMRRALDKNRAAQFWGVEEQWAKIHSVFFNSFVARTPTLETRLLAIKFALRTVVDLDEFTQEVAYSMLPTGMHAGYKKTKDKRIARPTTKHKHAKLQITYLEAHHTPEIRNQAVKMLDDQGDPIIEVVRGLDAWRAEHTAVISFTDTQVQEGHEAFEVLLLSSDKSPYAQALGSVAILHEYEISHASET